MDVSTGFSSPPSAAAKVQHQSQVLRANHGIDTISNSPTLPCATKSATCGSIFDPARLRRELAEIETKLADPALWSDPAASQPLMRDRKRLEALIADDEELVRRTGDIEAYFELAREGEDVLEPTSSARSRLWPRSPKNWKRGPCSPARPIR